MGSIATVFALRRRQQSKTLRRVAKNAPSLIQVLEQKKLLSLVERLGLLEQAENAGIQANTPEQLGLLKLAEDLKLLSTAETVATNPLTPSALLLGSTAFAALTYLDLSQPSFGIAQWVLAGALGAPAAVLLVAFLAFTLFLGGAKKTRSIDRVTTVARYGNKGFTNETVAEPVTLLDVLEQKRILSFLEENQLLTLATGLVNRPLTLTQKLGVLSTLESTGILSQVEATATDEFGAAAKAGLLGVILASVGLVGTAFVGPISLLLVVLALPLIIFGVAFGLVQAPAAK